MEGSIATMGNSNYDRMKELKEFDSAKIGVKGLSDSGVATIPKFFIHPPEVLSDLRSSPATAAGGIPTIDLAGNRAKVVEEVKEAAKTWGFFQVVNHGVPVSALDETIAAVKAFHDLPAEEKAKHYARDKESEGVMYTSNNDLYRSKAACWHDSLQVWMSPNPAKVEDIPAICRNKVVEWDMHAKKVAETIMELLSEGLGLEAMKFKELGYSTTRIILGHCYPHCPQSDLTLGIKSHTDNGVVTVLLQNQVQGLQVRHADEWVAVQPLHGALIINIGDFLQMISNDVYKSVEHRVVANSSKEARISIVEFFHADNQITHGPLKELLTPDNPPIYRQFTIPELVQHFFTKGLDSKSFLEYFKL